jgi:hypothetical protein
MATKYRFPGAQTATVLLASTIAAIAAPLMIGLPGGDDNAAGRV